MHSTEHRCGRVALVGPPNAGKSTLLNALTGHKISIVTARPQTTRNSIVGILTEKDAQIIFVDTPGLHHDREQMRGRLGKMMIRAVWQSLETARSVMLVLDAGLYLRKPEFLERDTETLRAALAEDERPLLAVINKVDTFHDKSKMLPLLARVQEYLPKAEIFPLSALSMDGVPDLKERLKATLPAGPAEFPEDQISTAPLRFLVAEIIREKLFERLRREVPYSTAVDIEAWEEDSAREQTVIHAIIYVARPTHKAMVIGRAGAVIKEIGTEARKDIRSLVGGKVHLELWVKVRENWTEESMLLLNPEER
jgi:GTP-binding protein Era